MGSDLATLRVSRSPTVSTSPSSKHQEDDKKIDHIIKF